jgi:hypothetical protein
MGKGIRVTLSKACGCEAFAKLRVASAMKMGKTKPQAVVAAVAISLASCHIPPSESSSSAQPPPAASPVPTVIALALDPLHTHHASPQVKNQDLRVWSSSDEVVNPLVRRALESYLSLSRSSTRGNLIRCSDFLQVLVPGVVLSDTVMKNSLEALRRDEADCADALRGLLSGVTAGDFEYCRHSMDETTGVLRYITWA